MPLSLLSDAYVSDSFNDAGRLVPARSADAPVPPHFAALCRGLVVLVALALPVGLTLLFAPLAAPDERAVAAQPIVAPVANVRG